MFADFTDLNKEFVNNIADKYKKTVTLNTLSETTSYNPQTGKQERTIENTQDVSCYVSKIDFNTNKYQGLNLTTESKKVICNENIENINEIIINTVKHKIIQEIQGAGYTLWIIDTL